MDLVRENPGHEQKGRRPLRNNFGAIAGISPALLQSAEARTLPALHVPYRASPLVTALLGDQRVGRAVIGIGALDKVVALRKTHDDVATMGGERR
jgi:hypothetical protein